MNIPCVAHTCTFDTAEPASSAEVRAKKWGHLFDIRSSTFRTAPTPVYDGRLSITDIARCTHNGHESRQSLRTRKDDSRALHSRSTRSLIDSATTAATPVDGFRGIKIRLEMITEVALISAKIGEA